VNQERNTRQVMHGPEMIFVWLTDLGKISNFSLDNVRRADNDNMAAVLKLYLASANNSA
jgi:hypothetical protein